MTDSEPAPEAEKPEPTKPTVEDRWKDVFQVRDELEQASAELAKEKQTLGVLLFNLQETSRKTLNQILMVQVVQQNGVVGDAVAKVEMLSQANGVVLENLRDCTRETQVLKRPSQTTEPETEGTEES